jgi:hypothetical protein
VTKFAYAAGGVAASIGAILSLCLGIFIEKSPLRKLSDKFMWITTVGGSRAEWYLRTRLALFVISGILIVVAVVLFRHA